MSADTPRLSRPWYAHGLGAGLLSAVLLAFAEWLRLLLGDSSLEGAGDHLRTFATALSVYGFVTIPLGLGFGLAISGFSAWLGLPATWQRLRDDRPTRERQEGNLAGLVIAIPVLLLLVAGATFAGHRGFVRHMNNPTLSAAFMALWTTAALVVGLGFLGVLVVIFRGVLTRLPLRSLARREPRLLRATLGIVAALLLLTLGAAFAMLYNPEVWPAPWVAFLFATAFLPIALTLVRPLVAWAGILRYPAAAASLLLIYAALSAWTFTRLEAWDGPRQAILSDSVFVPTVAGLVQRLSDMDGDGQSALLGGGDCDDSNAAVYGGAREIPGNGLDDNCLGGDAAPREDPDEGAVAEGSGDAVVEGTGSAALEGTGEGSGQAAVPEPPADRRRNLVILLIDTLRPDHLGFYGYERDISPNIDALAAESISFDRAYAQAPRTPGSIPSIVASRYASQLAMENPTHNYPDLREENRTLFEALNDHGYYTLGVASHYYFERAPGLQQGFDHFDNRGHMSISDTNTAIAAPDIFAHLEEHVPQLAELEEPFCLFIHYYEPHSRWMRHPNLVDFGETDSNRQTHINNYDAEIMFVDQYVGRTLELLRAHGLYDDTVVALVSDHGEAFDEHGHFFHGQSLYDEEIRVPFILRVPGVAPVRVTTPVTMLDLGPTLLDLSGLPPERDFQGRALVPLLPEPPVADIFSELLPYSNFNEHHVALVRGTHKLIYRVTDRRFELYDLAADPGEEDDIFRDSPAAAELQERLVGWMETAE